MTFTFDEIRTNPFARLLALILRRCTVILSTGKILHVDKGFWGSKCGLCYYEGDLSLIEEMDFQLAMQLIGA